MISLSVNKPPRDWTDRDIEQAFVQLGTWAFEFRKVETLAPLRDRPATRHAFAVVFGAGDGTATTSRSFDISASDIQTVRQLAKQIQASASGVELDVFLAALAEAGSHAAATERREVREMGSTSHPRSLRRQRQRGSCDLHAGALSRD